MSRFTKVVMLVVLFTFVSSLVASASNNQARVYTIACVGSKARNATWYEQVTCARYNSRGYVIGRLPVFFTVRATVYSSYYWQSIGMGKSYLLRSEWVIN